MSQKNQLHGLYIYNSFVSKDTPPVEYIHVDGSTVTIHILFDSYEHAKIAKKVLLDDQSMVCGCTIVGPLLCKKGHNDDKIANSYESPY